MQYKFDNLSALLRINLACVLLCKTRRGQKCTPYKRLHEYVLKSQILYMAVVMHTVRFFTLGLLIREEIYHCSLKSCNGQFILELSHKMDERKSLVTVHNAVWIMNWN